MGQALLCQQGMLLFLLLLAPLLLLRMDADVAACYVCVQATTLAASAAPALVKLWNLQIWWWLWGVYGQITGKHSSSCAWHDTSPEPQMLQKLLIISHACLGNRAHGSSPVPHQYCSSNVTIPVSIYPNTQCQTASEVVCVPAVRTRLTC